MNKNYYYIIFIVSLCFLLLLFFYIGHQDKSTSIETETNPFSSPFKTFVFGVGVVEAGGGNINIGASINRIVEKVPVIVGGKVKKGDELVKFESNDLQAEVMLRELDYQLALANLKKVKALPRSEDLTAAEANFKNAELDVEQAYTQNEMVKNLKDSRALSREESNRRAFSYQLALAKQQQAQAALNKVKAGTWKPDLDIAQLKVLQAKAQVMQSKSNLQRTIVKSPDDATILQIKIREGEVPSNDTSRVPLMIIGNTDELNLKVSINQYDVPHFRSDAQAVAFLQGDRQYKFPLEFIRIEPILVNKENLTNDISEKVDTDVLNIIYRIKLGDQPVFIGQQMDVYIEAKYSDNKPQE
ncbi:MAG: HlyD family efflux transporter periplasmic adaptor subunit [Parachlamydiaceae bacterium]|nr:HlyD family efflux transporter periplasmic adaptor subunit [Parachlamydiaceae bacterium]